eukprot:GHVU01135815.1.p2 GENE.GHVU01135815.1~~GHVU01135815.1.p2  ORF type:complete len:102 (+),score=3.36 GHVU01135815.1:262-567(+)
MMDATLCFVSIGTLRCSSDPGYFVGGRDGCGDHLYRGKFGSEKPEPTSYESILDWPGVIINPVEYLSDDAMRSKQGVINNRPWVLNPSTRVKPGGHPSNGL